MLVTLLGSLGTTLEEYQIALKKLAVREFLAVIPHIFVRDDGETTEEEWKYIDMECRRVIYETEMVYVINPNGHIEEKLKELIVYADKTTKVVDYLYIKASCNGCMYEKRCEECPGKSFAVVVTGQEDNQAFPSCPYAQPNE
jgi:hypothetical protein